MSTIKPLSPLEVKQKAIESIPSEMVQAVNELLIENASRSSITLKQKDIEARFNKLSNGKYNHVDIYDKGWMDIEPIFRNAGWKVRYESPDRDQSFDEFFTFTF